MYVIKKGKLYVAKSGSKSSYTKDIKDAERYKDIEEAKRNLCPENETIVSIYEEID